MNPQDSRLCHADFTTWGLHDYTERDPADMSISHAAYWLDRAPKARRRTYDRLRRTVQTSVVIVGGGLTGCSCALAFATAGVKVVLLEAEGVGEGAAGRSLGLLREDFDASFRETSAAHGLAAARSMWETFRTASLELAAVLRRAGARCDLVPADLVHFTPRASSDAVALEREYRARRAAGLKHSWLTTAAVARETALESSGAIRTRGATIDPYRACAALAAAAAARGAALFEQSPVTRIRAGHRDVEVTTDAGLVRAEAVVVATPAPLGDLKALRRHLKPRATYTVVTPPLTATVRRAMGHRTAALRRAGNPPHFMRWHADRALFSGADQPEVPARAREKWLVQRTGQLMYELSLLYPEVSGVSPEFAWDRIRYESIDRLPFAGVHRNFPRHMFAMSGGPHGAGFSRLAARVLVRSFQGAPAKGDHLFGFSRVL